MLHVMCIYLHTWVIFNANVGIHIPAPWVAYGIESPDMVWNSAGLKKKNAVHEMEPYTAPKRGKPGANEFRAQMQRANTTNAKLYLWIRANLGYPLVCLNMAGCEIHR